MWMICGILSVVFCVAGWIGAARKSAVGCWAAVCSLAFVALTLLMEYRQVLTWVNNTDWSALADVVPTMFSILTGYVVVMLLANAAAIAIARRK